MSQVYEVLDSAAKEYEQGMARVDRLMEAAQPGAVFSQPVTAHDQTVITASELLVWMGFGYGAGSGTGMGTGGQHMQPAAQREGEQPEAQGTGGGGGGGGMVGARPVAAIRIGPEGVRIDPIVDVTKLGLAALTTMGAMALVLAKAAKAAKKARLRL